MERKYEYASGNWIPALPLCRMQGQVSEMGSPCEVLLVSLAGENMFGNMCSDTHKQLGLSMEFDFLWIWFNQHINYDVFEQYFVIIVNSCVK